MELHIFDKNFNRVGDLNNYISCIWSESYQDIGSVSITADDNPENTAILRQGNLVYQKDKDVSMVIRYVKYNDKEKKITVHGVTALSLLDKRIISNIEYITNAESGMKNAVKNNLRGLSNIIAADNIGLNETFETQIRGRMIENLQKVAVETNLGLKMLFDYRKRRHIFTVYKGVNRTSGQKKVLFSDEFRNLTNMTIVDDMGVFKNVAYVAGAGEGADRKIIIVGGAQGDDRYEDFYDARDVQPTEEETVDNPSYLNRLRDRGIAKLNEHIHVKTFTAEVEPQYFRSRYNLGDEITCKSTKYGVTINTRIMAYKEVTEKNITKLSLTLGNPEIDVIKELRING